ncbi:MAG TPA: M23 family metallopeptidase [Kofleriaceae bacterium]|nr:M23 family metallopeptidase [Kofleriaceae bacterium]
MRRASLALAVGAALAAAPARAGKHPHREPPRVALDPRALLAGQLGAETESATRTAAIVDGKLAAADAARRHRLRVAARVLEPLPAGASSDQRMAAARLRAAARLLIERDAAERGLLAAESAHLRDATARIAGEAAKLPHITLPVAVAWPAHGTIARHFGTFEHERSKATLSRRGLDLEVDDHAAAVAPAAGIVRYAGPIRGLDRGVILDCGDYLAVIAKLGELGVPVGTRVAAGERLGRAARHRVYFELRVKLGPGGLPIDPEPLLTQPR